MSPTYTELRQLQQDVIDASQIIYQEFNVMANFFILASFIGHVSARIPNSNKFITSGHLHPFGRGMNGVNTIDDLIILDTDMRKISGRTDSTKEAMLHAAIYRARSDLNGITYAHPYYADLFAAMNKQIPTYGEYIPLWDSHGQVLTREKGEDSMKALGTKHSILLRNPHSLVTVADSLKNATVMATLIEGVARRDYDALLLMGEEYVSLQKETSGAHNPKYPWDDLVSHSEEFDCDVQHFDKWQELYDRHISGTTKANA